MAARHGAIGYQYGQQLLLKVYRVRVANRAFPYCGGIAPCAIRAVAVSDSDGLALAAEKGKQGQRRTCEQFKSFFHHTFNFILAGELPQLDNVGGQKGRLGLCTWNTLDKLKPNCRSPCSQDPLGSAIKARSFIPLVFEKCNWKTCPPVSMSTPIESGL